MLLSQSLNVLNSAPRLSLQQRQQSIQEVITKCIPLSAHSPSYCLAALVAITAQAEPRTLWVKVQ